VINRKGAATSRTDALVVVLITSSTTCQDVVDLLYNFRFVVDLLWICTTNSQQIEVMESALNAAASWVQKVQAGKLQFSNRQTAEGISHNEISIKGFHFELSYSMRRK